MDDRTRELARAWMRKAGHDLENARIVSAAPHGPLDTAIYHCQQAAEKCFKAFLTLHAIPFHKTHDLGLLLSQAANVNPVFKNFEDAAEELSPYAVIYRYPGEQGFLEPSRAAFDSALRAAESISGFVEGLLRNEPPPPG